MVTQERCERQYQPQENNQAVFLQSPLESRTRSSIGYVTDVDKNELAKQAVELRHSKSLSFDPKTIDLTKVDIDDAMQLIQLAIEFGLVDEVETMLQSDTSIAFTILMNQLTDAIKQHMVAFTESTWNTLLATLEKETGIKAKAINRIKHKVLSRFPILNLNIGCSPLEHDTLESEHLAIRLYSEMYDEVPFAFNTVERYPEMQHCIELISNQSAFACTEQLQHYGYCYLFEYIEPTADSDPNHELELLKESDYFLDYGDYECMENEEEYREERYSEALFYIESYIEHLNVSPDRKKDVSPVYNWVENNMKTLTNTEIDYDGIPVFFAAVNNYHEILKGEAELHIMNGMEDFFCMTLQTKNSINILETLATNHLMLAILSGISLLKAENQK
ncbi:hypothetical protein [Photobacterium lutimaris]|uniref:Uncharacterized protein n=1 Tax=Photobacterium lutimaris TaxID=388278 RepID=A0A2T3ITI1_9GAMM|nr:hypothetical protein [Photobacterium lutimaris]PSU31658.1 hypothetical protein C9I99_20950 [Photobacterium lutimaris]TDR72708.1 hypothetical protein DFP78_113184 [Photobacterium lutimaris]